MKNKQDFPGVKFTARGWSVSTRATGNVSYVSRALSHAVAFIPSAMVSVVAGSLDKLMEAEQILVKSIEAFDDDLIVVLQDMAGGVHVAVKLKDRVAKKPTLAVGATVKVRSVTAGYVLLLGGATISLVQAEPNQTTSQ